MMPDRRPQLDSHSGVPLYLQLSKAIRGDIEAGVLEPGSKAPSENELVSLYGVSRSTVRQAYQQLSDAGLLVKVRAKGTFVASPSNPIARPEIADTRSIGFLMRDIEGGVQPALVESVSSVAFDLGYSVTVNNTGQSLERALQQVNAIADRGAEGLIFRPLTTNPFDEVNYRICEEIQKRNLPFVFIDVPVRDVPGSCVRSDNYLGGRLLGEHLCSLGHSNVLVLTNCINSTTDDRIAGLEEGLGRSAPIINYYHEIDGDFRRKVLKEVNRTECPTAIFCINDLIASDVISLLSESGIHVPNDISVTGFDDLDFCSRLTPPITTVHQYLGRMGEEAVHLLIQTIQHPDSQHRDIHIPVDLIQRASVKDLKSMEPVSETPASTR